MILNIKHVTQNSICLNYKSVSTMMSASTSVSSQRTSRYQLGAIKIANVSIIILSHNNGTTDMSKAKTDNMYIFTKHYIIIIM